MADPSFIHRWFEEVWNNKREARLTRCSLPMVSPMVSLTLTGTRSAGLRISKSIIRQFVEGFPDMRIEVEDTVVEGDKIAARCRVTGSHLGRGIGVAPTNNPVEFTGMTIVRIKDGKIVEAWNEFNFMEMYQQLGALTLNLQ